jgi:1-acyl-sn-glycerol-3-phosphate acyltransferase
MRWFVATCIAYSCLFVLCSSAIIVCLLTFGWRKQSYFYLVCRGFGRIYLYLVGVNIVFEGGIPFEDRCSRIMTFNHTSQLDLFIMASLMPPGGVPTMKKEMLYVPVLGPLLWFFGALMINRGKQASAHASLADGARRMKEERLSVGIAPEGTRSRTGELTRFKKGTFHLAKAAAVPVERLLIGDAFRLQPLGQWYVFPGQIVIARLSPMRAPNDADTPEGWTNELRDVYAVEIEARRGAGS